MFKVPKVCPDPKGMVFTHFVVPFFWFHAFFMCMTRLFWKDIGPGLLFLVAGTIDTKFRCSTGVTTANSTNKNPNANKLSWVINYRPTTPHDFWDSYPPWFFRLILTSVPKRKFNKHKIATISSHQNPTKSLYVLSFSFPFHLWKVGFGWDEWLVTWVEKWKLTKTNDDWTL